MTERKPQDQDKFVLRLPDGMRDRIKAAADDNNRSMNAEIVATLEEKYPVLYSREETIEMIRASLLMYGPERAETLPPGYVEANRRTMVWVARNVLGEKDPEAFLSQLVPQFEPGHRVNINRFVRWQADILEQALN